MSEEEIKVDEDSEETLPEAEEAPKKKRKRRDSEEAKKINGKIDNDAFIQATSDIQNDSMVPQEQVAQILVAAMTQAYLEWSYPGLFRDKDSTDPAKDLVKADIVFENDYKKFKIYDVKTIVEDDDITDDSYQISPEDAQEFSKKTVHVGDTIRIPFDVKKLDKKYVRRVKQLFTAKLKDASKAAISSVYSNQIGGLIEGTVTRVDNDSRSYDVSFGKVMGNLRRNNLMPQDNFVVNDKVLVYLVDVSDKMNPPSLVVTRTNDKFIEKLLERYIPELQTGEVKIKAIAREAGRRSKVFVESTVPNLDPIGACIGPESSRIKSVNSELKSEKIDILIYKKNKALQVIEAMKPAVVIGMSCPDDFFDSNVHYEEFENDSNYEFPKITCVVTNGTQGVAIGTSGVNVRLASKITKCTISVLTADEAIKEGTKYSLVQDIRKLAGEADEETIENPQDDTVSSDEVKEIEAEVDEEMNEPKKTQDTVSEETPVTEEAKEENKSVEEEKKEEAKTVEEVKEEVKPSEPAQEEKPAEEVKEEAEVKEEKAEEKPVEPMKKEEPEEIEHIEIKNKPKISLEELEMAISSKKGPSETRSRKRWKKDDDSSKKREETPSMASQAAAMPIYTDEELKAMEEEEQNDSDDYSGDIDLDEYEDDKYYEDK